MLKKLFMIISILLISAFLMLLAACAPANTPGDDIGGGTANSDDIQSEDTNGDDPGPQVQVAYDIGLAQSLQNEVDAGKQPWRLDPLEVTSVFLRGEIDPLSSAQSPVGTDEMKVLSQDESDAVVSVDSSDTWIIKVYLARLIKKDDTGAWTVTGYDMAESKRPSIAGLHLGDPKEKVTELLGTDYNEKTFDTAEHFPETFMNWEYDDYTVSIGVGSGTILQIMCTAPAAATNLGAKIGDNAETALAAYRAKYTEPNSIQSGDKLYGVFKVEHGQAMILDFDIEDGLVNPEEIPSGAKLQRLILTYPAYLDESF